MTQKKKQTKLFLIAVAAIVNLLVIIIVIVWFIVTSNKQNRIQKENNLKQNTESAKLKAEKHKALKILENKKRTCFTEEDIAIWKKKEAKTIQEIEKTKRDLEILNKSLKEKMDRVDEIDRIIPKQADIDQKATRLIENRTNKVKEYKLKIPELKERIAEKEREIDETIKALLFLKQEVDKISKNPPRKPVEFDQKKIDLLKRQISETEKQKDKKFADYHAYKRETNRKSDKEISASSDNLLLQVLQQRNSEELASIANKIEVSTNRLRSYEILKEQKLNQLRELKEKSPDSEPEK